MVDYCWAFLWGERATTDHVGLTLLFLSLALQSRCMSLMYCFSFLVMSWTERERETGNEFKPASMSNFIWMLNVHEQNENKTKLLCVSELIRNAVSFIFHI